MILSLSSYYIIISYYWEGKCLLYGFLPPPPTSPRKSFIISPTPSFLILYKRVILPPAALSILCLRSHLSGRLLLNCFRTISREKLSWERNWGSNKKKIRRNNRMIFILGILRSADVHHRTSSRQSFFVFFVRAKKLNCRDNLGIFLRLFPMFMKFPPLSRYLLSVFCPLLSLFRRQKLIVWTRCDNSGNTNSFPCQRLSLSKSNI